jgi:hypothetical protein
MWVQPDQSVDLVDQAVDLGPVAAPPLVVVARMLHVHCGCGEHGVTGNELVDLLGVHARTVTNTRMRYALGCTGHEMLGWTLRV